MKCILIWTLINTGYLYKCPNFIEQPTCCNCTTVHSGTYDQEFMVMCNEPIETPATTTQLPTEIATTPSTVSVPPVTTSTSPLTTQKPALTTTETRTTTIQSTTPSQTSTPLHKSTTESIHTPEIETTTDPLSRLTTTLSPSFGKHKYDYIPTNRSDPAVYKTIIQQSSDNIPILITSLVISGLALFGCISLSIWSYKKHKETKVQKMVRPSQINLELSPSATQPLTEKKDDLENQLKVNKLQTDKVRQVLRNAPKAKTARPIMSKRPSEVKNMSLNDWKQLRNELQSKTKLKTKPQVNRKLKPPKKEFQIPPLPSVKPNNKPIVPNSMEPVINKQSMVQNIINKFNKQ